MMIRIRLILASLVCAVPLLMAGCSIPHVMGMGSYYAVTDDASGRIYYTDNFNREARGAIEFKDPGSGAMISLAAATVSKISEDEYRKGRSQ